MSTTNTGERTGRPNSAAAPAEPELELGPGTRGQDRESGSKRVGLRFGSELGPGAGGRVRVEPEGLPGVAVVSGSGRPAGSLRFSPDGPARLASALCSCL